MFHETNRVTWPRSPRLRKACLAIFSLISFPLQKRCSALTLNPSEPMQNVMEKCLNRPVIQKVQKLRRETCAWGTSLALPPWILTPPSHPWLPHQGWQGSSHWVMWQPEYKGKCYVPWWLKKKKKDSSQSKELESPKPAIILFKKWGFVFSCYLGKNLEFFVWHKWPTWDLRSVFTISSKALR